MKGSCRSRVALVGRAVLELGGTGAIPRSVHRPDMEGERRTGRRVRRSPYPLFGPRRVVGSEERRNRSDGFPLSSHLSPGFGGDRVFGWVDSF